MFAVLILELSLFAACGGLFLLCDTAVPARGGVPRSYTVLAAGLLVAGVLGVAETVCSSALGLSAAWTAVVAGLSLAILAEAAVFFARRRRAVKSGT